MASNTEVANFALSLVGSEPLTAFDSDTSKAGRHCRILLPRIRDNLNWRYRWNYAMQRVDLGGPVATSPEFGFDNAFALPTDLLRLWGTDLYEEEPFVVENGQLLTDEATVAILYSRYVPAVDDWTDGFRAVVELLLAAALAMPILREPALRKEFGNDARALLDTVLTSESQENKPVVPPADVLLKARLTGIPFIDLDVS